MDNLSELKAMPIWVCWNKIEKNGRMTKVPCSAHGSKTGTNEEYRGTWVRYDEAIAAAQKYMYSGVGFVIPQGWFFLDIDHKELDDLIPLRHLRRVFAERGGTASVRKMRLCRSTHRNH